MTSSPLVLFVFKLNSKMAKARQANAVKSQESQISKYCKALPPFPNTVIPHRYIVRYPREIYQVHRQGISDFLMMMMRMALMTTMKKKIRWRQMSYETLANSMS